MDLDSSIVKVAEIGCSRGYLSSYFIATGRDVFGFDISETAVKEANRAFGDHFHLVTNGALQAHAPYDAIFHVGTIGCVASPIDMTNQLLSLLKPSGWLLFNAPNKEYLNQTKTLWLNTPPPDLVTIFQRQFWDAYFGSVAEVKVSSSFLSLYEALVLKIDNRGEAMGSTSIIDEQHKSSARNRNPAIRVFRRVVALALRVTLGKLSSSIVQPYGVFVAMKKKALSSGLQSFENPQM